MMLIAAMSSEVRLQCNRTYKSSDAECMIGRMKRIDCDKAAILEAASGFEPLHRGFADLSLNHLGTPPSLGK